VVLRLPLIPATFLSAVLLFSPGSGTPPPFPDADKLAHFLIFVGLMWTALPYARVRDPGRTGPVDVLRTHQVAVATLLVYAVGSELLQAALPINRTGDVFDTFADTAGIAAVLAAVVVRRRHLARRRPPSTPTGQPAPVRRKGFPSNRVTGRPR
jgi:hypothetical protein